MRKLSIMIAFLIISVSLFAQARDTLDSALTKANTVINGSVPIKGKIFVISYESPSRLLSEYIAQELTFKLQRNTSRDIIDNISIDDLQKDYNLKGETLKTADALKIAKAQGADFLVLVTSTKLKDQIRLDVQIKNVGTGKNIQVASYNVKSDDLVTELLAGPTMVEPPPADVPTQGAARRIRAASASAHASS